MLECWSSVFDLEKQGPGPGHDLDVSGQSEHRMEGLCGNAG
jgi:hypothetical protein